MIPGAQFTSESEELGRPWTGSRGRGCRNIEPDTRSDVATLRKKHRSRSMTRVHLRQPCSLMTDIDRPIRKGVGEIPQRQATVSLFVISPRHVKRGVSRPPAAGADPGQIANKAKHRAGVLPRGLEAQCAPRIKPPANGSTIDRGVNSLIARSGGSCSAFKFHQRRGG